MGAFQLDWRAKHGPVWGTINVALGLWAGATVAEHLSIGGQQMALIMAAGLAVAMVLTIALLIAGRPVIRAFASGLAVLAGGIWLLIDRINPGSPYTLGALATVASSVAIVATVRRTVVNRKAAAAQAIQLAEAARNAGGRLAAEWGQRINRVCRVDGRVKSVKPWPNGNGFTLTFQPGEGGTTVNDIAMAASRLAADAQLPVGCAVEVETGRHRGEVQLNVNTVNAMAKEAPFPVERSPRSIYQPIDLGVHSDGSRSSVSLREASLVMAGQKGSGKTNRLHVLTAGLARCTDVLTWHIDLTGGLSLPWVQPWLDNRTPVPGVDWVATTAEEAQLMVNVALAIARGRKPAYRDRMRAADDDKLPIGPDVPQIVIVADEFRALPKEVAATLISISDEGRAPGVQTVACALRGTVDYLPRELLVQAGNRIAMRFPDEAELAYVLGWQARLDPGEVPHPGMGFVKGADDNLGGPRRDRAWRITPSVIDQLVTATAGYRPALDEVSLALADSVEPAAYGGRWSRYEQEAEQLRRQGKARLEVTIADHQASRRPPATDPTPEASDPRSWPSPRASTGYQRSDAHQRMVTLLKEALPNGLQPGALHAALAEEGFATERQTIHSWLALEMSRGTVRQPVQRGPYYAVVDEPARPPGSTDR